MNNDYLFKYKLIKRYLLYKLGIPKPVIIIISPTLQCNLKCKYCHVHTLKLKKIQKLMNYKTLKKIIDESYILQIPLISFSGGEPLILKNTIKIAKYAKFKKFKLNLNTNGTLINKDNVKKLLLYFDYIRISINGKFKHDNKTSVKGSFNQTLNGLKLLNKFKNNTKIGLNILYEEKSFEDIKHLIETYQEYFDFISILPKFNFEQKKNNTFEKINKNHLKYLLINKKIKLNKILIKLNNKSNNKYCDYGKLYLSIFPSGNVYGCPFNQNNIIGNINKTSLIKIVNKKFKKPFCYGCNATCTTLISKIFRMSPSELLRNYKYI
jgi:MoaA/NifB/PqqE/SkfB family radical SAM enzyme